MVRAASRKVNQWQSFLFLYIDDEQRQSREPLRRADGNECLESTQFISRRIWLLEGWHGWWWRKFSEGTLGVCLLKTEAIKNVIEAAPKRLRDQ